MLFSLYVSYEQFCQTTKGNCFPDGYHKLYKGVMMLIEFRYVVTCGTKQTHPLSSGQDIPTSSLSVVHTHNRQRPCEVLDTVYTLLGLARFTH